MEVLIEIVDDTVFSRYKWHLGHIDNVSRIICGWVQAMVSTALLEDPSGIFCILAPRGPETLPSQRLLIPPP